MSNQPTQANLPELTLKVIILAIILALVLGIANTYLALKIGLLTSASIPAAILSMGILRFFKGANILENNLVQTCASAGEAIAGGVVYTVPALIIIHSWTDFPYWETCLIALLGGLLGVLFSIPLRRILLKEPLLNFPEARAITAVLQASSIGKTRVTDMLLGGCFGALFQLAQNGFKLISNQFQIWFTRGNTLYGFGFGFSTTMIGAGYLIGFPVSLSIFVGAILGWIIGIPAISYYHNVHHHDVILNATQLWNSHIRYIGIGAMLLAGLWTLLSIIKPFWQSVVQSLQKSCQRKTLATLRTEQDLPGWFVLSGIFVCLLATYMLFHTMFASTHLFTTGFYVTCVFYVLFVGFIASTICGYFSGLVGVSASPGSSVIIASLLMAALILKNVYAHASADTLHHAAAMAILLGAMITGAAAVANDNMQDLKVGQLIGATPWKQQLMLIIGAVVASLVIPLVMQVLFNLYGIANVLPHPGMDPTQALMAPPAALMASITQGVFTGHMPWRMVITGFSVIACIIILNRILSSLKWPALSVLGVAIGIYLPFTTTTPIFLGGLLAYFCDKRWKKRGLMQSVRGKQNGLLLACGLIAGAALMDVAIAIPMAWLHNPDALDVFPVSWHSLGPYLGVVTMCVLGAWFYWTTGMED
ncbi:MAG: oligopeptide transporter, OPT family protein [marine bacterium B5-7]|nr:MAG: oligopeptide transporter, OPT family protein [marine bacterium B5-7]